MERVAIPVFESRVSPVLDSCQRMMVIDIEDGREIHRQELSFEKMSIHERIEVIARWGIRKIICAGISEVMCKFLAGKNIALVSGIAGEFEKIINAYICDHLNDACFVMPGKRAEKRD
ncbi:MAG: NifB/NifX family molybdenum-iron cluster-binding protein [Deltaproteobacteria bacterium]|nr:NifB/NifX family molybdenum-iron cluster-binding protein [Deltaproteobacteria bacterium]